MQVIEELLIGDYKIIQDDARYRFTSVSSSLQSALSFTGVGTPPCP